MHIAWIKLNEPDRTQVLEKLKMLLATKKKGFVRVGMILLCSHI